MASSFPDAPPDFPLQLLEEMRALYDKEKLGLAESKLAALKKELMMREDEESLHWLMSLPMVQQVQNSATDLAQCLAVLSADAGWRLIEDSVVRLYCRSFCADIFYLFCEMLKKKKMLVATEAFYYLHTDMFACCVCVCACVLIGCSRMHLHTGHQDILQARG
jgi:hypothetical protein